MLARICCSERNYLCFGNLVPVDGPTVPSCSRPPPRKELRSGPMGLAGPDCILWFWRCVRPEGPPPAPDRDFGFQTLLPRRPAGARPAGRPTAAGRRRKNRNLRINRICQRRLAVSRAARL